MNTDYIALKEIPEAFQKQVMTEFTSYSVALSRVRNNDATTFRALGTGIFVTRDGKFGILTAHHCLHECRPEVALGHLGADTLILIFHRNRTISLQPGEVYEHVLAVPKTDEFGPDLVFLEIAGEKKASILATASAWPLDRNPESLKLDYKQPNVFMGMIGFPEVDADTKIANNSIVREVKHMTFMNATYGDSFLEKDGWDYIDGVCDYSGSSDLPDTFGGVSGGPVWGMKIRRKNSTQEFSIESSALVGIVFYEGRIKEGIRKVRAHYIDSIYTRAWMK